MNAITALEEILTVINHNKDNSFFICEEAATTINRAYQALAEAKRQKVYLLDIGAEEFKQQRLTLCKLLYDSETILTTEEADTLEGLQNLCDEIADQAHDIHGLNCLNCDEGEI